MNFHKLIQLTLTALLLIGLFLTPALAADGEAEAQIDYNQLDNETAVFTYLTQEMGLSTAAACGVMANIEYESGFDPTAWGDGGTSHGLCQWHAGRCDNLSSFCWENGYDEDSVYGQLSFLAYELSSSYPSVLEYLQNVEDSADGAYDAAYYWCYYFEVPADRENVARQRGDLAWGTYYPAYENGVDSAALVPDSEETAETLPPPPSKGHRHPRPDGI